MTGGVAFIGSHALDALLAAPGYDLAPIYGTDRPGEVWEACLDATRAAQAVGWRPAVSLRDGLARTLAYFQGRSAG